MNGIRSFIAFDIEDPEIIRNIGNVQSMILRTGADLKLVKPQNIHITIRFLGNILPSQIDKIYNEMKLSLIHI
mgnify:FL=1